VIRAHQPGSEPIDIPETIPNPVVLPKPTPNPSEPAPKEPVRTPEKVPLEVQRKTRGHTEQRDLNLPGQRPRAGVADACERHQWCGAPSFVGR
jgi:hypothetical protein